jgi:methionyl-tRNA formyltransferase
LLRAYKACAENLYEAIKILQRGNAPVILQRDINQLGFYCVARKSGDEYLDWNQPSRDIFNFVRALCLPGPVARTYLNGIEIKVNKAQFLPQAITYKGIPGAIIGVDQDGFLVKTADSFIKVLEWSCFPKMRIGDRLK